MFNDNKKGAREIIEFFTTYLKREYGLDAKDIQELLAKKMVEEEPDKVLLPAAIFSNDFLSTLETITKYLKEAEYTYIVFFHYKNILNLLT